MPNEFQYNTTCTENIKINYTLVKKENGERKRTELKHSTKVDD